MLSHEHLKLLLQAVAVVLALHFAKGSMTGEYRNLVAVGLVVVVLVVVNHLFAEYEGADTTNNDDEWMEKCIDCSQINNVYQKKCGKYNKKDNDCYDKGDYYISPYTEHLLLLLF